MSQTDTVNAAIVLARAGLANSDGPAADRVQIATPAGVNGRKQMKQRTRRQREP